MLESLRANLPTFTLATVLQEVGRWMEEGISLFARQWQELQSKLGPAADIEPDAAIYAGLPSRVAIDEMRTLREEVTIDPMIAEKARRSVERMINLKN